MANVGALTEMLVETFRSKSSQEWTQTFVADRIPGAPVNDVAEAMAQPIAKLRNMVEELDHPGGEGTLKFLGNPYQIRLQPAAVLSAQARRRRPARCSNASADMTPDDRPS